MEKPNDKQKDQSKKQSNAQATETEAETKKRLRNRCSTSKAVRLLRYEASNFALNVHTLRK